MAIRPTDPSLEELIARCAHARTDEAWAEFVARTRAPIGAVCGRVARRWGARDPALIEDLVQETYAKLLAAATLERYQARGPEAALGFVKVVAASTAHDHLRSLFADKRGGSTPAIPFAPAELAEQHAAAPTAEEAVLLGEIEACLVRRGGDAAVDRDLLIFQLHYRLGLTAEAIASIPAIELGQKGVESALARMIADLRRRLTRDKARALAKV